MIGCRQQRACIQDVGGSTAPLKMRTRRVRGPTTMSWPSVSLAKPVALTPIMQKTRSQAWGCRLATRTSAAFICLKECHPSFVPRDATRRSRATQDPRSNGLRLRSLEAVGCLRNTGNTRSRSARVPSLRSRSLSLVAGGSPNRPLRAQSTSRRSRAMPRSLPIRAPSTSMAPRD